MPGLRGQELVRETIAQVLFDGRKMWNQGSVFDPHRLLGDGEPFTRRPDAEQPNLCGSVGCLVGWAAAEAYPKNLVFRSIDAFDTSINERWLVEAGKGSFDDFYDYLSGLGFFPHPLRGRAIRKACENTQFGYTIAGGTIQIIQLVACALELPHAHWAPLYSYVYQRTDCRRHALLNFLALCGMTGSEVGARLPNCERDECEGKDEAPLRRGWIAAYRGAKVPA